MKNEVFPFVSIIIPIKDQEKTMGACINSLLNLNYLRYEVIIVDNNSKDGSQNIVQKYKNKKIKLLFEQKPGSYNARNKGIQIARGEIIAFTDGDCVVNKNWLKFLVQPFKDEKVGGVGGKIDAYKPKNEFELYCDTFCHPSKMHIKRKKPFLITSNVAYRKRILKKVGLFDGNLYSGGDVDISWKTMKLGYKLYFEPKAIVAHVYEETPFKMSRKFFRRGKYRALLDIRYKMLDKKKENKIHVIPLRRMIGKYPLKWVLYRIAQDFFFHLGFFCGSIFWKIKNKSY